MIGRIVAPIAIHTVVSSALVIAWSAKTLR